LRRAPAPARALRRVSTLAARGMPRAAAPWPTPATRACQGSVYYCRSLVPPRRGPGCFPRRRPPPAAGGAGPRPLTFPRPAPHSPTRVSSAMPPRRGAARPRAAASRSPAS